jgi:RNA polymerase sigma-70 factor (ECF subfamily)
MEDEPVDRSATLDAPILIGRPRAARDRTLDRERALDRFLAGVERRALRIATLALRDRAEAEDAVQDAMMRLVQHYAGRPEEEWRPLFYRILGNRITDCQRRARVRRAVMAIWPRDPGGEGAADPVESAVDPRGRPDESLEGEELLARLESVLAMLSARQREAFLLRNFEGLDVAQAAVAMGCSEGSVKTHYFRAMQALEEALQACTI